MEIPEEYIGREQTFVKHLYLRHYLETVAYHILSNQREFVYIDGYSGPWHSGLEDLSDTSFAIAIDQLRRVKQTLQNQGKTRKIKCLFVENDQQAFERLKSFCDEIKEIDVQAINGDFLSLVPHIKNFIGEAFSLTFIDPTGWSIDLNKLKPLLRHKPGEVIFNFMFDYINRFVDSPNPNTQVSFERFFGTNSWNAKLKTFVKELSRAEAITELFREQVMRKGNFEYVTSTSVLKTNADRTHYYLFYGTRHTRGLEKIREVEKKVLSAQHSAREEARENRQPLSTEQPLLPVIGDKTIAEVKTEKERRAEIKKAETELFNILKNGGRKFDDIWVPLLTRFILTKSDVKKLTMELSDNGKIEVRGMRPRQRRPKGPEFIKIKE